MARLRSILLLVLVLGCEGTLDGPGVGPDARAPDRDGQVSMDASAPGEDAALPGLDAALPGVDARVATDSGTEPSIDAGPCGATLAASLSVAPIAGVPSGALAHPTAAGGVALAWRDAGGIAIQRADGAGVPFGAAISVAGDGLWGLAASPSSVAVLVSRGDELVLAIRALDGAMIADTRLMGAVPHDVTNNEWFGTAIRAARLDWDGTRWVAYATVNRLWPDGIAHYGDTLRTYAADGSDPQVLWGWGCSHSMEVRLTHNAAGIGPVCSSDCYPDKGVFFMHRTELFLDASGDCRGYVQQRLGGIAPVEGGFVVGWTSAEGRASVDAAAIRVGDDGARGAVQWLSSAAGDERELHLGPLGSAAIAAWIEGGEGRLARVGADAALVGSIETIDAALIEGASDVFRLADGDTAWVVGGRLVRVRACE